MDQNLTTLIYYQQIVAYSIAGITALHAFAGGRFCGATGHGRGRNGAWVCDGYRWFVPRADSEVKLKSHVNLSPHHDINISDIHRDIGECHDSDTRVASRWNGLHWARATCEVVKSKSRHMYSTWTWLYGDWLRRSSGIHIYSVTFSWFLFRTYTAKETN